MRKGLLAFVVISGFSVPALASGGMGDPSQHIKDMNRICEMQRHGIGPLSPNLCLDEYPAAPVERARGY
jgi:hypothetical protein